MERPMYKRRLCNRVHLINTSKKGEDFRDRKQQIQICRRERHVNLLFSGNRWRCGQPTEPNNKGLQDVSKGEMHPKDEGRTL